MKLSEKNDIIYNIKDEVKELHPLLFTLFKSMPGILNTNKTHGVNEMGSDFILTRQDIIIGDTEYIGVIAKSVQIKQDYSDIKKQIEECCLPRLVNGGVKEIYLSEIWIITSKTISSNAQKKINHEFRDKKIKFIDGAKLVSLIDTYLPYYWGKNEIQVTTYFNNLKDTLIDLDKNTSIINLRDYYYINQDIEISKRIGEEGYCKASKRKKVNIIQEIIENDVLVVEGGVGCGKSKLLRHVALSYADDNLYDEHKIIPIYINYCDLLDKYDNNPIKLANSLCGKYQIIPDESKFLFLIDGVDEICVTDEQIGEYFFDTIRKIENFKNSKVVCAMRYAPITGKKAFSIRTACYYTLKQLSLDQVIKCLKTICENIQFSFRLIEDIKKSTLFKEIPKSPISTLLLAKLISEDPKQDLPSSMTELYSKYFELMLGRWDADKGLKAQKEYEAINSFSIELAKYFLYNKIATISKNEAVNIFVDYLSTRNLHKEIDGKILLENALKTSGLFVQDAYNNISFKHRTFFDFFVAKSFRDNLNLEINNNVFSRYWSNIYYFYIGLRKDCPDTLNDIMRLEPASEDEEWGRIFFAGQYFLAGFLTPYQIVKDHLPSVFIKAAILYWNISRGKVISSLQDFPPIVVFVILQTIFREYYSYEYFRNSLSSVYLSILDSDIEDDIKFYAIYLVGLVAYDLKELTILKDLIFDYGSKTPFEVQLSIEMLRETDKNSAPEFFRKNLKRLRSVAKGSKTYNDAFDKLQKIPISRQISK